MVTGCGKWIGDHGCQIKDEVGKDSNLGSRSARRSTQRSVAKWSAEPGAEAAQIRRAGGWGGLFTGPAVENGSLKTRRRRPESVNNPVVMRPPELPPQRPPAAPGAMFDRRHRA
jgi:hypothetical protein